MKIANKITLSFLTVAILLSSISVSVFYFISKYSLENLIDNNLEAVVVIHKHHIDTYLEMLKASINQLSKSVVLENFLKADKQNQQASQEAFAVAMKRLHRTKEANPAIFEFLLLDLNGKVVAATNEADIGMDKSTDAFFTGGQKETYIKDIYYSQQFKKGLLAVSTPFLDSETGELLGVLAARIELAGLYDILTDRVGLGQTGEVYIVNKYGVMVTPSRFLSNTFLKQKVDSLNLSYCLLDV